MKLVNIRVLTIFIGQLIILTGLNAQNTFPPTGDAEIKGDSKNLIISNTAETESGIIFKDPRQVQMASLL